MSLTEFESSLEQLIGRPTDLRPFVCDGSPLDCKVFIVGFNPATPMPQDFWQFWKPGVGFDKSAWLEAYKQDRQTRPLRPGQTRRNPVSNTRRVIDWITTAVAPIRCLETNIYATPTEAAAALDNKDTRPFEFLLRAIQPRLLVVHGNDAAQHIQQVAPSIPTLPPQPHFSRGWSKTAAQELAAKILLALR
jgi:hypothetical protein